MSNYLKDKVTILLCTCDAYNDLWEPFFKLFDKFGGDLKELPIVINTEYEKYKYNGLNIECPNELPLNPEVNSRRSIKETFS